MKHVLPSHFLLLCIGLLSFVAAHAQLHGEYTIDPSGSGSTNYISFQAAVTALENQGVDSAVTFYVKEGTYTEQLTIDSIPGTSSSNTVLFTANPSNSSEARLEYAGNCDTNWVVNISGGDYLTFDQLVIRNTAPYPCHRVFLLEGHSQHITIQNSEVSTTLATGFANPSRLISNDGSGVGHITLIDNTLFGAAYGVRLQGVNSSTRLVGITLENNDFEDQYARGVLGIFVDSIRILGNSISADSALDTWSRAIELGYCDDLDIIGNTIYGAASDGHGYGIYLNSCIGASGNGDYHWIANNCVKTGNTLTTAERGGIYLNNSGILNIVHNAVDVQTTYLNNQGVYLSGGLLRLHNNVIRVPGGTALHVAGSFSVVESDNNAYYSGSGTPFYFGSNISSLANWQSTTGFDMNSHWTDAAFLSGTSCASCNAALDNAGSPISGLSEDMDGLPRSTNAPDIGPIEFVATSAFSLGPDSTYCSDSLLLEAGGATSVSWLVNGNQVNSTILSLEPDCEPETYTVAANVQTAYCGAGSDVATLTVVPSPNLANDLHLCAGESVTLASCGGNSASYTWSDSSNANSILVKKAGVYEVIKTELGCVDQQTVLITQSDSIQISDIETCWDNMPVTVEATISNGVSYAWSGGSSAGTAVNAIFDEGSYSVSTTDIFGCTDSLTFEIEALSKPEAVINETHSGTVYFLDASSSLEITENSSFHWECDSALSIESPDSISTIMHFPWFSPSSSFSIVIKLTVDNGCGEDSKTIYIVNEGWPHPGIEDVQASLFTVFPNPMKHTTTFRCDQCAGAYTFRLMDAAGRLCEAPRTLQRNQFDFYRDELPAGIYFYELESVGFHERGKLVIE